MNRLHHIAVLATCAVVAACGDTAQEQHQNATSPQSQEADIAYPSGSAGVLISPGGNELGSVQASDDPDGVALRIDARGLQPGMHGVQVHTVGKCQGPNFVSAGPRRTDGGGLPNVSIESDGLLTETVIVPGTNLAELRDSDGFSLVLHMNPDNPPSDQSGNAGDRIACAVI